MLAELRIENLAVISSAELFLSSGLNVITGETGAGKTILANAISLLLGARGGSGLVRPAAEEASIEAVFTAPEGFFSDLAAEIDIPSGEDLIVRRRLSREGRSRAYLGGRAVNLSVLEQITGRLLAFSAQHEQRQLMMASRQLDIVDTFAGEDLFGLKEKFARLYDERSLLLKQIEELGKSSEAHLKEAELLRFQLQEIEAVALMPGEDVELEAERRRLLNFKELQEAAASLATMLGGDGGGEGLIDTLSSSLSRIRQAADIDEGLGELASRLEAGFYELEDIGRAAHAYSASVDSDPGRLAEIEERLDLLNALKRKYGASIEEVNLYAEAAETKLARFSDTFQERPRLENELKARELEMAALAQKMRRLRLDAAAALASRTEKHLEELAFSRCRFEARLIPLEGAAPDSDALPERLAAACTRTGSDAVEFLFSPNPGMPLKPVRETASGGELSRIMLAIKSSAPAGQDSVTMVFDEIDAGIGGATGLAVGSKLKSLAGSSQIICITHLPQIACFAGAHFSVLKESGANVTQTRVLPLQEEEIIDELCRMMGSKPEDVEAREHARSLKQKADSSLPFLEAGGRIHHHPLS